MLTSILSKDAVWLPIPVGFEFLTKNKLSVGLKDLSLFFFNLVEPNTKKRQRDFTSCVRFYIAKLNVVYVKYIKTYWLKIS